MAWTSIDGWATSNSVWDTGTVWNTVNGWTDTLVAYARYNGGKELHDASGHLPRDEYGFYLSRTSGERLVLDEGWEQGDSIGEPKVYGLLTAVVTGTPASARRSGFDNFSLSNYVTLTLDSNVAHSAVTCLVQDSNAVSDALFVGADASDDRWAAVAAGTNTLSMRTFDNATEKRDAEIVSAGIMASGATTYAGLSISDDGSAIYAWDETGTLIDSATDTAYITTNLGGAYYLGRDRGSGEYTSGTMAWILGWDGSVESEATMEAYVEAMVGGANIDDLDHSAALATDGMVCGAYDPAAPTELFELSGTGVDVTAEYEAVPTIYARYNGGKELRDATGTLSVDASNFYLSRGTGERLRIDAGWAVGDSVGVPTLYGDADKTASVGLPDSSRRGGVGQTNGAKHPAWSIPNDDFTFIMRLTTGTLGTLSTDLWHTAVNNGDPRADAMFYRLDTGVRWWTSGNHDFQHGPDNIVVDSTRYFVAQVVDKSAATNTVYLLDSSGTVVQGPLVSTYAPATTGDFGRTYWPMYTQPGAGGTFEEYWLWKGTALSQAQVETVVGDRVAGSSFEDAGNDADIRGDGLVTGVYDAADPTSLIYETGSGDSVTVVAE